jgi:hypothetical protein
LGPTKWLSGSSSSAVGRPLIDPGRCARRRCRLSGAGTAVSGNQVTGVCRSSMSGLPPCVRSIGDWARG